MTATTISEASGEMRSGVVSSASFHVGVCTRSSRRSLKTSLRAGRSSVKRAVHARRCRRGARRSRARSPGPGPSPRRWPGAAPEALEARAAASREARPLVGHADRGRRPRAIVTRPSGGPCLRAFATRLPTRALERLALAAATLPGRSTTTLVGVGRPRASASRSTRLAGRGAGRVLAGEREQVVEQGRQPRGVGLDVGEHRGIGAVAGHVGGVAAQRGQRRAQLVRGVADEAVLGLARALERGEHRVQRLGELRRPRRAWPGRAAARAASPERSIARAPDGQPRRAGAARGG